MKDRPRLPPKVRITLSVRADLAAWLRAKATWQQRSLSGLVEDALDDLREEMGEPGEPRRRSRAATPDNPDVVSDPYCCDRMRYFAEYVCPDEIHRGKPLECPDRLVTRFRNGSLVIIVHTSEGNEGVVMNYCPWCGADISVPEGPDDLDD
jgi:hypothetical protein